MAVIDPGEHYGLVRAMMRHVPHDPGLRDDLFQQGCVGLLRAVERFDPSRGTQFSTFAAACILGEMRELMRSLRTPAVSDEQTDLLPDPTDFEQRVELRDILRRLPDQDQRLIVLRHELGLSQAEAGRRLGMSQMQVSRREQVIRTLLRRAVRGD